MKRLLLVVMTGLAAAQSANAIETLRIHAARVSVAGTVAHDVTATLAIRSTTRSTLSVKVAGIAVPAAYAAQVGPRIALQVECDNPMVREPLFECPAMRVNGQSARWPKISLRGAVAWQSDTGVLTVRGTAPEVAGSPLKFNVSAEGGKLRANLDMPSLSLPALREFAKPWISLPADLEISGAATLSVAMERVANADVAVIDLAIHQGGLQNAAYTWIGEKIEATVHARVDLTQVSRPGMPLAFEVVSTGSHGQFLGGPVLLDFDRNPLEMQFKGTWANRLLTVTGFKFTQRDLLAATGSAVIELVPLKIRNAEVVATDITFPSAYATYVQLPLATTPFNQLVTQGKASATLRMQDDKPVHLDLVVEGLEFRDDARELHVTGVDSELYWSAGATGPQRPSFLSWESARGWGFVGAKSRVDFVTSDRNFRLLSSARLPLFDGALIINTLAVERAGKPDMAGDFDAVIEPISVAPIAKAMGWPEFSGRLSGRVPGLTYREGVLALEGDLEASVFDGQVVASNLRVREPLGQWPRLYADIIAFDLDLDLVTHTFEFGSITGRVDVDLKGLETIAWSPVAFDLRIVTPKDDKSPHRISQRAVANLSNMGGGGGAVIGALQSGALQFFETFHYDQIGLSCRLRNDVCQMSGVGPAPGGYYILRGAGLPHLDIIGKSTRVDWPRFVSQLVYGINNSDSIVVN